MNNKRVLILTGTTEILRDELDPSHNDATFGDVFDATLPSKIQYARKHGYDILAMRSFGENRITEFGKNIGNLKVYHSFEMLKLYDVVMWIDADSVITNQNLTIEHFMIDKDHTFYASYDWMWKNSFSAGNFIVQNTENLNELMRVFFEFVPLTTTDQQALNKIHRSTPIGKTIKVLDHRFLGAVPKDIEKCSVWKGRPSVMSPWKVGDFLAHMTGVTNKDRLSLIDKVLFESNQMN
jgi:hypothetical protein